MTAILGISAFYHDSAAALVVNGDLVAAAQEERFTRKKHDHEFPVNAITYCLQEANLAPEQIDLVGFYDKPFLKFERLLETYLSYAPYGYPSFLKAMPLWLKQKLHLPREISRGLGGKYKKKYVFTEHHESHAASAFFPSPFQKAAILTLDGVGEWATTGWGVGRGNRIELNGQICFPHSLGLLYSAFTYYCGFSVNSGEYKLMGLAPYGKPKYVDIILDNLIDLKEDGSYRLNMEYFNYCQGLTMTTEAFHRLFGGTPRKPESKIKQRDMDIAASIQKVTEEIMLRSVRYVHKETGMKNLCMAGGVALNCVGNGRILREGPFENIWIQPAAGDAGGALGVALFIWYQLLDNERVANPDDSQLGSLLGKEYSDVEIEAFLKSVNSRYEYIEGNLELCDMVADEIDDGKVIGWYQGRMEFGPRALGSRSILGDARNPHMQSTINRKVKFREGFRPFAPVVLAEHVHEYFKCEKDQESPYMLFVAPLQEEKRKALPSELSNMEGFDLLMQERSVIPAVTHVDYSARMQTVDSKRHGLLRQLMEVFYQKTGCPVMVNTSFNLGWDPIVATPQDAYQTFMASDIDILCMGHYMLRKSNQPVTVHKVNDPTCDEVLDDKIVSPCCRATLIRNGSGRVCTSCGYRFDADGNIPQMFWPHEKIEDPEDVTEKVKAFYEKTPFPNYNDHDSIRSLIEKSRQGIYARTLDQSIPYNTDVLEVGCGTGQLTNFLGSSCRRVIGTDMCLNSLKLGEAFRQDQGLDRVRFLQMNLFRTALREEQFDLVICNGVLHHTIDPYGGFKSILQLVKHGGHILIALYNRYGRLATDIRRFLFRLTSGRAQWIDPILRQKGLSQGRQAAWFADQYQHPHESKHTIGEVLNWFDENGLEFVSAVPSVRPFAPPLGEQNLFKPEDRGTAWDHFVVQTKEIISCGREGGFFVMIARKPKNR